MGQLDGRVALVTGAGRGIGAAVARGLAAEGACVMVNDLGVALDGSGTDTSPAQEVVDSIVRDKGVAIADGTSVTDFEGCAAMIERCVKEFGRLDVLVNVAGILRDRMIFKMSEEDWDAVIDVHLKGTFNTTRHASAWWRDHRGGRGGDGDRRRLLAAALRGRLSRKHRSARSAPPRRRGTRPDRRGGGGIINARGAGVARGCDAGAADGVRA